MNTNAQNYQQQGAESNINVANKRIAAARSETPEHLRVMFRSSIRWNGAGGYTWTWTLR